MFSVGVDIGGMSIKIGIVDDNGKILVQSRVKTAKTAGQCISDMVALIKDLLSKQNLSIEQIRGIGIGCPGATSKETGTVVFLPNLGWENVELSKELKKHFNTRIELSNDANVAALGETVYGVAKDYNSAVMFTLGTGVGGGIVIDKKLFEGGWSRGAELGHTTLYLDGIPCTCGRSGCVERYVSATALIEQTKTAMKEDKNSKMWELVSGDINAVDGRTAFECSKTGDNAAVKVVNNYVKFLGESMLNFFNVFRPEAFILGGGVSAQGEYLNEKLRNYCEKYDYGYKNAPKTAILTAKLGNDAGIIGAAALVK